MNSPFHVGDGSIQRMNACDRKSHPNLSLNSVPSSSRSGQRLGRAGLLFGVLLSAACSEALYPPRPPVLPGPAIADPPHSRVNMHISLTQDGLSKLIEATVPAKGEVPFSFLGQRKLVWQRSTIELRFNQATGMLGVRATINGEASLPATSATFSINLTADAQPVLSSDYIAQLQAPQVQLTSDDRLLRAAEWSAGALSTIKNEIEQKLRDLRIDLRPMLAQNYVRLAKPVPFRVGDAQACFKLGLQSIEAGPTVLAGGIEKDLSAVVAPSVTMPCTTEIGSSMGEQSLPPLHNVASIPAGPFEVTIPVVATYIELQKAMSQAFTGGKLQFDPEYPDLYLEKPEVYSSGGQVVTKLHLDGFVKKGLKVKLSGDLYMAGHPQVRDNELEVPDLEPTIETKSVLLKLKTSLDTAGLKRTVRQALRLDIGARLQAVREKLGKDLVQTQRISGGPEGCIKADVGRIEVTSVFAHDTYLRLYVKVGARAAAYLPCPVGK